MYAQLNYEEQDNVMNTKFLTFAGVLAKTVKGKIYKAIKTLSNGELYACCKY